MKSQELVNLVSAVFYLSAGSYGLYVVRKHSGSVRQLPDIPASRKIKRMQKIMFVISLLLLLAGAWKFSLFLIAK